MVRHLLQEGKNEPGLQYARHLDAGVQESSTDGRTCWGWVACLDRLDLEVEGDEGEDQALHASRYSVNEPSRGEAEGTHLEILNQIVEHSEAFRVLTVLNVDERANLGSLESDVVSANPNFQLLLPDDVFLGPILVIFPVKHRTEVSRYPTSSIFGYSLRDLARLYDPLQLLHNQRTNPHFAKHVSGSVPPKNHGQLTLFANQTVITIVGVIGISQTPMRVLEFQELVAVLARVARAVWKSTFMCLGGLWFDVLISIACSASRIDF